MGFDDLEAAEQDRPDKEKSEPGATEAESATASAEQSTPDSTAEAPETTDSEPDVSDAPAFEYDDVKQSPPYARPEAWTALEDALDLDVVRSLRETGIRNEEKRELHDAVLRVAADHPDEIAEAVREAREGGD